MDDKIVRLANKRDECSMMQPNLGAKVDLINQETKQCGRPQLRL